jgi:hypothetical protein
MARLLGALAGLFVLGLLIGGAIAFTTRPANLGPVGLATATPPIATVAATTTATAQPTPAGPTPTTSPTPTPQPTSTFQPTPTVAPVTPAPTAVQTPSAAPPLATRSTSPAPPAPTPAPTLAGGADPADIPQFISDLSAAIAAGTNNFLFTNLHPEVLVRYGQRQCRAYTRATELPGLEIEYLSDTGPAPWDWTLDDVTTTIPDAQTVTVNWHDPSVDEMREVHIAPSEGTWRWFTDCGDPVT